MPALARGQGSDCANPALDLFTQVNGALGDVAVLEFQIFDVSDPEKRLVPVQVHPPVAGTRAPVNLSAPCTEGGDKLSTGRFVARWTPSLSEPIGTHEVRWFFRLTLGAPEQTFREEFEVLAEVGLPGTGYAQVSDLRAEGVGAADASDARLQALIIQASRYVERITGRFFEPRVQTLTLDGTGGRALLLGHPIIGVERVTIDSSPFSPGDLGVDPSLYRVYNRHLTQGLLLPDDRDNPKIELFHGDDLGGVRFQSVRGLGLGSLVWPRGQQNITVRGVFGYTEPDGSPAGSTPALIRHVTKLLVMRELPRLADLGRREDAQRRWRITSERTRDQSYTLESLRLQGAFTGDPEIDGVLEAFTRPPDLGAA